MKNSFIVPVLFALLLCLGATTAWSQNDAGQEIAIRAGLVETNNPVFDSVVLLEFPFTLNRQQFEFYRPDTADPRWYSRIFAQVVLLDARGLPFDSVNTYFSVGAPSREIARTEPKMLFNTLSLPVRPGVYTARLQVIDAVSKRESEVFYDNVVAALPGNGLTIGGERLAYRIRAVDESNPGLQRMVHNGLEVLTNPVGLIADSDTAMYLYAELYNLRFDTTDPGSFEVGYRILNKEGLPARDLGFTRKEKPGPTAVIAQRFDIGDLLAGYYTLEIAAADPVSHEVDTASLEFRIISPDEIRSLAAQQSASTNPWDSLSLEQQLQVVRFLLTPEQRRTIDGLTDAGKRNYLVQFWRDHDELPFTEFNETRAEMVRRWQFANENFSEEARIQDGWQTDRGRIYLTYGQWDERKSLPVPVSGPPFSVWYYRSIDEGLVFVFVDRYRFGEYILEHSNADGEHYDQTWARRLQDQSFFELEQDLGTDRGGEF